MTCSVSCSDVMSAADDIKKINIFFFAGYFVGNLTSKKPGVEPASCLTQSAQTEVAADQGKQEQEQDDDEMITHDETPRSWNAISQLLDDKLTGPAFDERLK